MENYEKLDNFIIKINENQKECEKLIDKLDGIIDRITARGGNKND